MRHGYTILNQSVNVLTEYGLPKMPYAQVLLRDCARPRQNSMGFFFTRYARYTCSKGQNRAFCKNVVLKKLKAHFKRGRIKTGLTYLHLLHENAPAHKAQTVTEFLESEK